MRVVFAALTLLHFLETGNCQVNYIASNLGVKFEVISNLVGGVNYFTARITLTNDGAQAIAESGWELHYMSIYMLEPEHEIWKNPTVGYEIPGFAFKIFHINGCLFKFVPTSSFAGIGPGGSHIINLKVQFWSAAKTDNLPNWYVVGADGTAVTVDSTATENLNTFTGTYNTSDQWKRYEQDKYNPWSLEERWNMNAVEDLGMAPSLVIPTPKSIVPDTHKEAITKPLSGWVITISDGELANEAGVLAAKLRLEVSSVSATNKYIHLKLDNAGPTNEEGYKLTIDGNSNTIEITSRSSAGIYYGCQTFLSIYDSDEPVIQSMAVEDSPRYAYRGMHIDVARHFMPYEDIAKMIEVMGMYKLNKLHFHLTDDEGWRVEMAWNPYLTTVGATQCHDPDEKSCIYPQFGSKIDGTGRGSGFYTKQEYLNLLRLAENNHIEVIPEVDLPGHSRAAIKATEEYLRVAKGTTDQAAAESIQLSEPGDPSLYLSVQMYTDGAINPCIDSTYEFVRKTVETFVEYHKDIQPLKVIHLGGDEVPSGAWVNSTACKNLIADGVDGVSSVEDLGEYFVQRASEIVKEVNENLTLGLWEDGAITDAEVPFELGDIATREVLVNTWQNIWEWGLGDRPYKLANAGYKVVMSQATHLYFDHPEEPDPEERGFYWATRYTNTKKTFGFTPDDLYANIETSRAGDPITEQSICADGCTPLEKPENIYGMQGHIWTETMRNRHQFYTAIFPRMLALAERAWHKADWESISDPDSKEAERAADWEKFANTLGYKELRRLDEMEVAYRVPVAGVKVQDNQLHVNGQFPGLELTYSNGEVPQTWSKYTHPLPIDSDTYFQVKSKDNSRGGRIVAFYSYSSADNIQFSLYLLVLCLAVSFGLV